MTARNVLVTGSAGSIGATIMRGLPSLGWSVRGVDRVAGGGLVGDITSPRTSTSR